MDDVGILLHGWAAAAHCHRAQCCYNYQFPPHNHSHWSALSNSLPLYLTQSEGSQQIHQRLVKLGLPSISQPSPAQPSPGCGCWWDGSKLLFTNFLTTGGRVSRNVAKMTWNDLKWKGQNIDILNDYSFLVSVQKPCLNVSEHWCPHVSAATL